MVQAPVVTSVTVAPLVPEVVQTGGVCEAKLTARPEVDVALRVNVPLDRSCGELGPLKVMVWLDNTEKLWLTSVAAA